MRILLPVCLLLTPLWAFEGLPTLHAPLVVVVESEKPIPSPALQELQAELDRLLAQGQRRLEWKLRSEIELGVDSADLVLVRFRGTCRIETVPLPLDERGPLAFTYTADGNVLPFAEVFCNKLKVAARSAMHGGQLREGDKLLGRAMARVLAHEIWHITGNLHSHGKRGIAARSLTGAQLISDRLDFDRHDTLVLMGKTAR